MNRRGFFRGLLGLAAIPLLKIEPEKEKPKEVVLPQAITFYGPATTAGSVLYLTTATTCGGSNVFFCTFTNAGGING